MTWQQIRQQYPNKWVLMEALRAHTEGKNRIFEDLSVIESVSDGNDTLLKYKRLHGEFPQKEIVFYHTSREQMDIEVEYWNGIRTR